MSRWLCAALLAAGCVPEYGPVMRPGEDCLSCHGGGTGPEEGPAWSAAGTVYAASNAAPDTGLSGAFVHVTDKNGLSFTLRSNLAGNFYTSEPLAFPLQRVCVERDGLLRCMQDQVRSGSCNTCHTQPPREAAPGRLTAP